MNGRTSISSIIAALLITSVLSSCGGGGGDSGGSSTPPVTYSVGGEARGVNITSTSLLVLQNNGGDTLSLNSSGTFSFTFATRLTSGSTYSISVATQPSGQNCTVANGSGTVSGTDVTNISLKCRSFLTFAAAANFSAGTNPHSVAIGDFNGDGKPDLVTANSGSNNISILSNTTVTSTPSGPISFGTAVNYNVGTTPEAVAIGDFNGDGKLDLVVTNSGSNNVSILLGTGTGSFGAATPYGAGTGPTSVVIGDFNRDGKLDIAVANSGGVSILLNSGTGTFPAATPYGAGTGPMAIAVGDFNGDGILDLVVANSGGNVSILIGTGSGTFGTAANFSTGTSPRSVAVGDFNGDGKLDLAVANSGSSNVSILLGNGDGTFGAATNFAAGTTPYSVVIKDVNNDGKLDLVVIDNAGNVSILHGNGTGSFGTATTYAAGTSPYAAAVGDLNRDGKLDIAVANSGSSNVSVLTNTTPFTSSGSVAFSDATNFATTGLNPKPVVAGDFNGDGKLDLAVANTASNSVSVLPGTGNGSFGAATTFSVGGSDPEALAIGDFNRDGKLDIAVANYGSGTVSILQGNGDGSFGTATTYAVGPLPTSITVGDFNGDGKLDLAVANYSSGEVSILLGNGDGTFLASVNYATGDTGAISVAVGDFNGDGRLDLAVATVSNAYTSILLGNGNGTFGAATLYPVGNHRTNSPNFVAIGDFNGDGKLDIAVSHKQPDTNNANNVVTSYIVSILYGIGNGAFDAPIDANVGPSGQSNSPYEIVILDFNGDGKADIGMTKVNKNSASIILGTGQRDIFNPTVAFAPAAVDFSAGIQPYFMAAGDFNGDGTPDLAVSNLGNNDVSILLNQ
jgi:hypothetical protein